MVGGLSGEWEPRARIRADQGRRRVSERLAEEGGVCDSTVRGRPRGCGGRRAGTRRGRRGRVGDAMHHALVCSKRSSSSSSGRQASKAGCLSVDEIMW